MFPEQLKNVINETSKGCSVSFFMCDQVIKSVKLDENYTKGGVKRVTKKKNIV